VFVVFDSEQGFRAISIRTLAPYSNVERGTANRHLQYLFWKIFVKHWAKWGWPETEHTCGEPSAPPGGLPGVDSFENGRRLRTNETWIPHAESDGVGRLEAPSRKAREGAHPAMDNLIFRVSCRSWSRSSVNPCGPTSLSPVRGNPDPIVDCPVFCLDLDRVCR